jgi:uncharacterized protein YbcC (UPF0753/DUF2309 family)
MSNSNHLDHVLHDLKHYLPAQAPLKDFIHHNTLHGFQSSSFFEALQKASTIFGYKTLLPLSDYRARFLKGEIEIDTLKAVVAKQKPNEDMEKWIHLLLYSDVSEELDERIGKLRREWVKHTGIDLDSLVHPILFRILCSYLDQGISTWRFPEKNIEFLQALRSMESSTHSSFFATSEARNLLISGDCSIQSLLKRLVGDASFTQQYLFDQQFAHQGWSGIVVSVENQPESLLDGRKISLEDLILFELLLEYDMMVMKNGPNFPPLCAYLLPDTIDIFAPIVPSAASEIAKIWQLALEKSFYDQVLKGLAENHAHVGRKIDKSFQAVFCIDDRECSIRRHLEDLDNNCETFGTPGFFGVAFYYQPEDGKFKTKLCPAPVTPSHLIKANGANSKRKTDAHFSHKSHSLLPGFLITQTLGFWSAMKLFAQIFKPSMSPATSTSLQHMHKESALSIEHKGEFDGDLQVGFTKAEMADRVEALLKSMGLVRDFAPLIYMVSHGSSSVNNPHFSAYDCGACCGRPGSVNARVVCHMANDKEVRELLKGKGIMIPDEVRFIGALHDTSRDEIVYYDEQLLSEGQKLLHKENTIVFADALKKNAIERARRFVLLDKKLTKEKIFQSVRNRSVSLFEPRPELNHATNTLCIVGSRNLTRGLFLDRRAFLNSYDASIDTNGDLLYGILKAAAPVCGGINLEYFFSRVDNQRLGAGSKLPHNVMGLIGVANGIDGDLRPGLPSQMIEVHDPLRLMIIVEQEPEIVLSVIQRVYETYEWFINDWIQLVAISPSTKEFYRFEGGHFEKQPLQTKKIPVNRDLEKTFMEENENLPVMLIES